MTSLSTISEYGTFRQQGGQQPQRQAALAGYTQAFDECFNQTFARNTENWENTILAADVHTNGECGNRPLEIENEAEAQRLLDEFAAQQDNDAPAKPAHYFRYTGPVADANGRLSQTDMESMMAVPPFELAENLEASGYQTGPFREADASLYVTLEPDPWDDADIQQSANQVNRFGLLDKPLAMPEDNFQEPKGTIWQDALSPADQAIALIDEALAFIDQEDVRAARQVLDSARSAFETQQPAGPSSVEPNPAAVGNFADDDTDVDIEEEPNGMVHSLLQSRSVLTGQDVTAEQTDEDD